MVARRIGAVGARRAGSRRAAHASSWPASATTCATSPSPRATRSRPSCGSASRSTPTASTTSSRSSTRSATPTSTSSSPSTPTPTPSRPSCCPAASGTTRCGTAPASSSGCGTFLTEGGFGAFTTNFEDLGGLRQLPGLAVQRLMADGYGFGGEGDWKTSVLLRGMKVMAAGLPGGTSFMEDYTYHLVPGEEKILGAHMLEVCPSITTAAPSLEVHPLGDRRPRGPGAAALHRRPGRGRGRRPLRPRRPLPADRQRDRRGRARRGAAAAAGRLRGLGAAALAVDLRRVVADGRRPAPHGAVEGDRRARCSRTSPR